MKTEKPRPRVEVIFRDDTLASTREKDTLGFARAPPTSRKIESVGS